MNMDNASALIEIFVVANIGVICSPDSSLGDSDKQESSIMCYAVVNGSLTVDEDIYCGGSETALMDDPKAFLLPMHMIFRASA